MNNKTKLTKIALFFLFIIQAIFLLSGHTALAQVNTGLNQVAQTGLPNQDLVTIVINLIRLFLGFLGLIAVILIMYAGWVWMSSGGNAEKLTQAKQILKNAIIGLIIITLSFAIVSFVLRILTGSNGRNPGDYRSPENPIIGGLSATENGDIQSVYPAREQQDVPRNTSIVITFRQEVEPANIITGDMINSANVQIQKQTGGGVLTNVKAVSVDNKTFVFTPVEYLGSGTEKTWYLATITLDGIFRKADSKHIVNSWSDWKFEVSDKIDLTPPQVLKGGIYPAPDNLADGLKHLSDAIQASSTVKISAPAIYQPAAVSAVVNATNSSAAVATVRSDCLQSGDLQVNVEGQGTIVLYDSKQNPSGQGVISGKTVNFVDVCDLKLTLKDGDFAAGNLWTITVNAMVSADTLTVGSLIYTASSTQSKTTFAVAKNDNSATAQNLVQVLAGNPDVLAVASDNTVILTAMIAGKDGDNIKVASNDASKLTATPMSGGTDKEDKIVVNGNPDVARNSVIKINFNKAINPLTVSGKSSALYSSIRVVNNDKQAKAVGEVCNKDADCQSFVCRSATGANDSDCANGNCACKGQNNYLDGNFIISNQYRTVEFISNNECGVNACGEKIYCLPEKANLRVEINAANLANCDPKTNDNCAAYSPYNSCNSINPDKPDSPKVCQNTALDNYPMSKQPLDGIADLANNSLDGNRDGKAQGPLSNFNENEPDLSQGDNFLWSFFTSDKIDLSAPKIAFVRQADDKGMESEVFIGLNLYNPLIIGFDKLMMSSSLGTGETVIFNGQDKITHKLINLWNFISRPLGYWVTSEDKEYDKTGYYPDYPNQNPAVPTPDNIPDWTEVFINHSGFVDAATYRAQVGSGVKDIFQNCYKPSAGPKCAGVDNNSPSCCNGIVTAAGSCQ